MENIFKKNIIPNHYFNFNMSFNITHDLYYYLYDSLENENYETFRWDLRNALTINVNGEYI
jgi:hypothetical protein